MTPTNAHSRGYSDVWNAVSTPRVHKTTVFCIHGYLWRAYYGTKTHLLAGSAILRIIMAPSEPQRNPSPADEACRLVLWALRNMWNTNVKRRRFVFCVQADTYLELPRWSIHYASQRIVHNGVKYSQLYGGRILIYLRQGMQFSVLCPLNLQVGSPAPEILRKMNQKHSSKQ